MEIDIKKEVERLKVERQQNINQLNLVRENIIAINGIINYLERKIEKKEEQPIKKE